MAAGVLGAHVMSYLRVLTPNEVTRLTDKLASKQKVAEVQLVTGDGSGSAGNALDESESKETREEHVSKARIIPFNRKEEEHSEEESPRHEQERASPEHEFVHHELTKEERELEEAGIMSAAHLREEEAMEAERKKREEQKSSTTVFILEEKRRTREAQRRLREQEAVKSYRSTASGEVDSADLAKSNAAGVLINKSK